MSILPIIGLTLLAIVVAALLVALFVEKDVHAEREIVINKPRQEVFAYVKYLKNQNEYSKWGSVDPGMKKEFRGTDGTAGFSSAWDSENKNVGKGEQTIKAVKEGERVDYGIRFLKPMKSNATAYMITEPVTEGQSRVKWGFASRMPYPFNLMRLFVNMGKLIGDDFQTGLNNLKAKLENGSEPPGRT